MSQHNTELHKITTADGNDYFLNDGSARFVLIPTPGGWGLPPTNYVRQDFYKFDGQIELGFFLETRNFSISIRNKQCSRADLFTARENILNAMRPNRNGQLTYTFIRPDGVERAIVARAISPVFPEFEEWDDFAFMEDIDFEAIDPTWFSPTAVVVAGVVVVAAELVFPITFPILFTSADLWGTATINYTGNWYSYPVITATGPFTRLEITNSSTNIRIDFLGALADNDTLTFDFRQSYDNNGDYVGVRITDSGGNDVSQFLGPNSDLINFRIEPDPIAADGINEIVFDAPGQGANTDFSVSFNTRFIGI